MFLKSLSIGPDSVKCVPVLYPLYQYIFILCGIMNCLKCNASIDVNKEKCISCDGCSRMVHVGCSELSAMEIKCYELRSSKRRMKYICIFCEQGVHQIPMLVSMISDLKEEIRKLRENQLSYELNKQTQPSSSAATEEIISEMLERNKRSSNLVIFGSEEKFGAKTEQVLHDEGLIRDILNECNVTDGNIKPIRLGKFDPTRQVRRRPIKVKLSSPDIVQRILRKCNKIKSNEKFTGLSVNADRTPRQLAYFKSVKSDLNVRLSNGESNLKIKYINGIPTITSTEN